jgi:hypothetical protein
MFSNSAPNSSSVEADEAAAAAPPLLGCTNDITYLDNNLHPTKAVKYRGQQQRSSQQVVEKTRAVVGRFKIGSGTFQN